jgi:hypothetical protein
MPRVIVTAEVEDKAKWEEGFLTHGELFREQTVSAVQYGTTDANEVAVCFTVSDLDTYQQVFNSPSTAEAMAYDGIKRETVKVFVLDKEWTI